MRKLLCFAAASLGFVAILLLLVSGPLYRLELMHFSTSFQLMRWAAYLGIATIVLVVLAFAVLRPSRRQYQLALVASLIAGLVAFYLPYSQLQTARSVPPIHDITTDTENPPEFVDIAPLRADAPNPVEYPGEEVAAQQREAYPDLQPKHLEFPLAAVHQAALQVIEDLGWELVSAEPDANGYGRIEATDTTFWFGFKDDVVIRLQQDTGDYTRVDVRSKSRVGGSDVGANAERIRTFLDRLEREL